MIPSKLEPFYEKFRRLSLRWLGPFIERAPARNQAERRKILIEKQENCTVFNDYQAGYKHGSLINEVHPIHEQARNFYALCTGIDAKNIVEFGTGHGGSALVLAAAANYSGGRLISVDPGTNNLQFIANNMRYWGLSNNWTPHLGEDSLSFRKIYREKYNDRPIDVLFIDSGHTYSDTKYEIEVWEPLVRKGGIILFHDIVWDFHSVQQAVDEFLDERRGVYITPSFKRQCSGCDTINSRPLLDDNRRPDRQSPETFDAPASTLDKSFNDYDFKNHDPSQAQRLGFEYAYEIHTNAAGLGILYKFISTEPQRVLPDYKSNFDQVPWPVHFYVTPSYGGLAGKGTPIKQRLVIR